MTMLKGIAVTAVVAVGLILGCARDEATDITIMLDHPTFAGTPDLAERFCLLDRDPNLVLSGIQVEGGYSSHDELFEIFGRKLRHLALDCGRDPNGGQLAFKGIAAGRYWVVSTGFFELNGKRLMFLHPVTVSSDGTHNPVSFAGLEPALIIYK